jgi:Uma2 family endonuclease
MSAQEFDAFVQRPENVSRRLELIGGEVIEVVPDAASTRLTVRIARLLKTYLNQLPIGHATPPGVGYEVGDDRYMPDIGFIGNAHQPAPSNGRMIPSAPDLAFEVVPAASEIPAVLEKVINYQLAGTTVWVAYLKHREVHIFVPRQPTRKLTVGDTLDGGAVLPGFKAALVDLFGGE